MLDSPKVPPCILSHSLVRTLLAEFVRLRKTLGGSKFLGTCSYVETLGNGPESFDVTITGEWELKRDSNPFTNAPATALCVEPEKLVYQIGAISSTNKVRLLR
jgi:hypothetical protein